MRKQTVWKSEYFCGNKVSEYGLKNGYIDYRTLAKSFDAVLNNNIINYIEFEQINGIIDNSERLEEIEDLLCELVDQDKEETEEYKKLEEEKEELEEEERKDLEITQYYIIDDNGYNILSEYTHEIILYNSELDIYLWGVTHWGTSWDYVLTDIKIEVV